MPSADEAVSAVSVLAAKVKNAASASTFLTVASLTITVTQIVTAPAIATSDSVWAIVGIGLPTKIKVVEPKSGSRRKLGSVAAEAEVAKRRRLAPTTGAYVDDLPFEYVEDRVTQMMRVPNMITCFLSGVGADLMVNEGRYVAIADQKRCNSATSSLQGVFEDKYSMTVTRASSEAPMIMKGHMVMAGYGLYNPEMKIFIHVNQTASPEEAPPNGIWKNIYALYNSATDAKLGYGTLSANGVGLEWSERFGSSVDRLYVEGSKASGSGAVMSTDDQGSSTDPVTLGYNTDYFCRKVGTAEKCFDRDKANAEVSTWRYGVYKSDGSRLDLDSPGFGIKTVATPTRYGHAGEFGVHVDGGASDGIEVEREHSDGSTTKYTVVNGKGTLKKIVKSSVTLDDFDKVSFWAWYYGGTSGSGTFLGQSAGTGFQLHWDKSLAKFVFEGVVAFGSTGQVLDTSKGTGTETAADVQTAFTWGIFGYCEGYNAQISVSLSALGATTPGTEAGGVTYFTESKVYPGDTSVPTSFACINNCLSATKMASYDSSDSDWPYDLRSSYQTAVGDKIDYTWDPATYELRSSTLINKDTIDSAAAGSALWESFRMDLVATTDLSELEDDDGSHYLDFYVREKLTTYYTYETGVPWYFSTVFLKDASNAYVTFSAPLTMEYTVTSAASSAMAGAKFNLKFEGFGNLHGIPGYHVDPNTNEETSGLTTGARYVAKFSIPAGDTVQAGGTTYWVKPLESEIRFKSVAGTSSSLGVTLGDATDVPAAKPASMTDADDPSKTDGAKYAGAYSADLFDVKPKVKYGEVQ